MYALQVTSSKTLKFHHHHHSGLQLQSTPCCCCCCYCGVGAGCFGQVGQSYYIKFRVFSLPSCNFDEEEFSLCCYFSF
jgi:hypothetical protein